MSAKWSISVLSKTPMAPYIDTDNNEYVRQRGLEEKLAINIATIRAVYAP